METIIRVSADKLSYSEDDVVVIQPTIPPSEIPYFVIISNNDGKISIKNEYLPRNEHVIHVDSSSNITIYYGEKSGRVYEVITNSSIRKSDIINSITNFCKKITSSDVQNRFALNLRLTSSILKRSITKADILVE